MSELDTLTKRSNLSTNTQINTQQTKNKKTYDCHSSTKAHFHSKYTKYDEMQKQKKQASKIVNTHQIMIK